MCRDFFMIQIKYASYFFCFVLHNFNMARGLRKVDHNVFVDFPSIALKNFTFFDLVQNPYVYWFSDLRLQNNKSVAIDVKHFDFVLFAI